MTAPSPSNPGASFDPAWVAGARTDPGGLAERSAALAALVGDEGADEHRLAIRCLDLTTLSDDDTAERVRALCAEAQAPAPPAPLHTASVCILPAFLEPARAALAGSPVRVCTVAAGFPDARGTLAQRIAEVADARERGADEIDVVIDRGLARAGDWPALYDEVRAFRDASGPRTLKVILATGDLADGDTIAAASRVALLAGADFLKTSTGREAVNATLEAGLVMADAIRAYGDRGGPRVGLKPAGGIRLAREAFAWLHLARAALGEAWLDPGLLRFGASSLLADLRRGLQACDAGRPARPPGA